MLLSDPNTDKFSMQWPILGTRKLAPKNYRLQTLLIGQSVRGVLVASKYSEMTEKNALIHTKNIKNYRIWVALLILHPKLIPK